MEDKSLNYKVFWANTIDFIIEFSSMIKGFLELLIPSMIIITMFRIVGVVSEENYIPLMFIIACIQSCSVLAYMESKDYLNTNQKIRNERKSKQFIRAIPFIFLIICNSFIMLLGLSFFIFYIGECIFVSNHHVSASLISQLLSLFNGSKGSMIVASIIEIYGINYYSKKFNKYTFPIFKREIENVKLLIVVLSFFATISTSDISDFLNGNSDGKEIMHSEVLYSDGMNMLFKMEITSFAVIEMLLKNRERKNIGRNRREIKTQKRTGRIPKWR